MAKKDKAKQKAASNKKAKPAEAKKTVAPAKAGKRINWFDEAGTQPALAKYVSEMSHFIDTMADGIVSDAELAAQEKRLVARMKEVEPLLDDTLHKKVTDLLCELCAYDLMQTLHGLQVERLKKQFRG